MTVIARSAREVDSSSRMLSGSRKISAEYGIGSSVSLKARAAAERQLDRMTSRLVAAPADRGGCELYAGASGSGSSWSHETVMADADQVRRLALSLQGVHLRR